MKYFFSTLILIFFLTGCEFSISNKIDRQGSTPDVVTPVDKTYPFGNASVDDELEKLEADFEEFKKERKVISN